MHVPDGVLPVWLLAILYVVSGLMLIVSVKMINKKFDEKLVPYMGVLAAVIFAAQFVNFPVPPSSGHLVGSTLLAVMLGPWGGMLIIGMVLFVQALYGDGGLLTYGLNFFNMGVFSCFVGWALALLLFKGLKRYTDEKKSVLISAAIASYVTVVSAFHCARIWCTCIRCHRSGSCIHRYRRGNIDIHDSSLLCQGKTSGDIIPERE
jgi:cobalt/nickel transport system permease protein